MAALLGVAIEVTAFITAETRFLRLPDGEIPKQQLYTVGAGIAKAAIAMSNPAALFPSFHDELSYSSSLSNKLH